MSKRFILSFAAAVLIGLASAEIGTISAQDQWAADNAQLAQNDHPVTVSNSLCNFVDKMAYFNLDALQGPFLGSIVNADGSQSHFEVKFCGISSFNATEEKYTSMVWALDADKKRTHAVAGSAYTNKQTVRDEDMNVAQISYDSWKSRDYCVQPEVNVTEGKQYYTTFNVKCDAAAKTLTLDNFDIEVNPADPCNYIVTATHAAGCPTFEVSGFMQYLSNNPGVIAVILISFGVASTFFGGLLWDYVVGVLAGIIAFFITASVMDAFGGFDVFQEAATAKAGNVLFCIVSFIICLAASGAAGWFAAKTNQIAIYAVGAVGGFFGAILVYGLVFAHFLTNIWFIWAFWFLGGAAGGYLAYKFEGAIITQLTAVVGAYALIRGISMFAGGFISEYALMEQIKLGEFELPGTFYAYLVGFAVLAAGGIWFQFSKGYNKQNNKESLNGTDDHYHLK